MSAREHIFEAMLQTRGPGQGDRSAFVVHGIMAFLGGDVGQMGALSIHVYIDLQIGGSYYLVIKAVLCYSSLARTPSLQLRLSVLVLYL